MSEVAGNITSTSCPKHLSAISAIARRKQVSYCHFSTNIGSFDYFFIISHNNIVACKNTEELANIFVAFKKYFKKYVNCFFFLSETPKRREKNIRSFPFSLSSWGTLILQTTDGHRCNYGPLWLSRRKQL